MYTSDYAGMSKPYTSDYAGSSKAKSKSVKPKNVNKNIKVSQSEIDTIKKMGMTKALASAGSASASMQEGIRRLYGERRYQAATYKPNGVTMPTAPKSDFRAGERASVKPQSYRAGERSNSTSKSTTTNSFRAGERSTVSSKVSAPKNTSFNKAGVAGVLKSPEAKKFRSTFAKKGLIPALRGK